MSDGRQENESKAPAAGSALHTPGPWSPYAALGHMYVHGPDGEELAEVAPWGPAANCILMAAAPALADALEALLHDLEQGAMWCVSVRSETEIVGIALVGWPAQEWTNGECDTLAVLRVAVKEGHRNACSMLYGACSRAARAMGCDNLVTYTHGDEHGTSLKASGWIMDILTDGGEYDRPSRQRELQIDPTPKRRWWAPWSSRGPKAASKASPLKAVEIPAMPDSKG